MAITPKGIVTPDGGTGWNLVPDLAAMATSIDAAIDATVNPVAQGAHFYTGTSAQRASFLSTAVEGDAWQDSNGSKLLYVKKGTAWAPVVPTATPTARGSVSKRTVGAGAAVAVNVSFPAGRFSSAPTVVATMWGGARDCSVGVDTITATGCVISLGSNSTVSRNMGAQWFATLG